MTPRTRHMQRLADLDKTLLAMLVALAWSLVAAVSLLYPLYADAPPDCGAPGTDWYYECTTGDPIDLTPTIEDEADTTISTERN